MAFFESLEKLPGFQVQRDFSATSRLPAAKGTTYFSLAVSIYDWQLLSERDFQYMDEFVADGGRLVITIFPESGRSRLRDGQKTDKVTDTPTRRNRWGVDFDVIALRQREDTYEPALVETNSGLPLPKELEWHSGIVFGDLNPDWKPIYVRGGNAVVIERMFGHGTVVMATDSYFLSNEAMWKDRHAPLLTWLIGPNRNVLFDEAHFGIAESAGVATLVRRYRLNWFVATLILLGVLFIWKNAVSLVPSRGGNGSGNYVGGRDAAAGFINLLRRNISPAELLATCFAEWKKSALQSGRVSAVRIEQAEAAFQSELTRPPKHRNSVEAYGNISKILQTRKQ
jgi:hypothetical protein